jgi:large subunit ribosomal protein L10
VKKEQKAAVVERIAGQLESADAVIAVDYRGLSVKQAVDLRKSLTDADAKFQVAKNTLTERAADKAGADAIKPLLEGPTALTFVNGDVALAAKVLATFRRQNGVLEFKGGQMGGEALSTDQIEALSRLPARDVLFGQFVGLVASPVTGLVRGLGSMIGGLALQLGQIVEKGLIAPAPEPEAAPPAEAEAPAEPEAEAPAEPEAEAPAEPEADAPAETEEAPAEPEAEAPAEAEAEAPAETEEPPAGSEAPGDPVAEAEEEEQTSDTPSEGDKTETEEG